MKMCIYSLLFDCIFKWRGTLIWVVSCMGSYNKERQRGNLHSNCVVE